MNILLDEGLPILVNQIILPHTATNFSLYQRVKSLSLSGTDKQRFESAQGSFSKLFIYLHSSPIQIRHQLPHRVDKDRRHHTQLQFNASILELQCLQEAAKLSGPHWGPRLDHWLCHRVVSYAAQVAEPGRTGASTNESRLEVHWELLVHLAQLILPQIGKYAMKHLINKLADPRRPIPLRLNIPNEDTITSALACIHECFKCSDEFAKACHKDGGSERMIFTTRNASSFTPKIAKYACHVSRSLLLRPAVYSTLFSRFSQGLAVEVETQEPPWPVQKGRLQRVRLHVDRLADGHQIAEPEPNQHAA